MHLSHLGLTVSHIPSATAFYLACLQPLGYRYIGHRGDSIGLGVSTADFFLSQEQNGDRIAPTHIAFAANDRYTVRACYAAALHAGAAPSGAPSYRNDECSCFNAAVHDLDGNTIEFVYDETCGPEGPRDCVSIAPSQLSKGSGSAYPESERRGSCDDGRCTRSATSRAGPSRYLAVMDLASATSKSIGEANEPTPGITRSRTEPIIPRPQGKALVGTIVGAAAGAAFLYAALSTERSNAREEAEYNASIGKGSKGSNSSGPSATARIAPKRSESTSSRKYPPRSMSRATPRAIERPPLFDEGVWETYNHHIAVHRPAEPSRSRTYNAPPTEHSRRNQSRGRIQRCTTLPIQASGALTHDSGAPSSSSRPQPLQTQSSRRSSANDIPRPIKDKDTKSRHDSVVEASTSDPSRHRSEAEHHSSAGSSSTIKPSQRRRSSITVTISDKKSTQAAAVPLRPSRAGSYMSATAPGSAAQVALPASRVSSSPHRSARNTASMPASTGGGRGRSVSRDVYFSSSRVSHVKPRNSHQQPPKGQVYDTAQGPEMDYESDGLGDFKTVVPDDSISCVDFSSSDASKRGASVRRNSTAGRRQGSVQSSSSTKPKSGGRRSETAESQRTARRIGRDGFPPAASDGRVARTVVNLPSRGRSKNDGAFRGWHSAAMDRH